MMSEIMHKNHLAQCVSYRLVFSSCVRCGKEEDNFVIQQSGGRGKEVGLFSSKPRSEFWAQPRPKEPERAF